MQKVVAIVGPTAVGKTSLAIELAKKLDGEIVSGDSMQIYKEVAIGTAKAAGGAGRSQALPGGCPLGL